MLLMRYVWGEKWEGKQKTHKKKKVSEKGRRRAKKVAVTSPYTNQSFLKETLMKYLPIPIHLHRLFAFRDSNTWEPLSFFRLARRKPFSRGGRTEESSPLWKRARQQRQTEKISVSLTVRFPRAHVHGESARSQAELAFCNDDVARADA